MKSFIYVALRTIKWLIILLFFAGVIKTGHWYYKSTKKEINCLANQIKKEQTKNESFIINNYRIRCMMKTLILAYGLSKWEAYYYSIIFNDFSTAYKIPWEIYPSIIRVESNFNPTSLSPKNCKGLMQIKESTGKEVAKKIGINYKENSSLWNEIINIVTGCTYLSTHIKNKGLKGGVKSYLGGPDYLKSIKKNEDINKYVSEYKASVWKEFVQLSYIFRGIVDEFNKIDYTKVHEYSYADSIFLDMHLFPVDDSLLIDTTVNNIIDTIDSTKTN